MEQTNEHRLSLSSFFFLSRRKSNKSNSQKKSKSLDRSSKNKSKNGKSIRFWSRKQKKESESKSESSEEVESETDAADTEFKIRPADKKSKIKDKQKHKSKQKSERLSKQRQKQQYLKSKQVVSDIMDRKNDSTFCMICFETFDEDGTMYRLLNCNHYVCMNCLETYLQIEVSESRVMVNCPICFELVHPNEIRTILKDEKLVSKYEDFMLRKVLAIDPDTRWCPAPDCGFAVIASGCASCPKLKCERPGCNSYFCYHCKSEWHPNQTCDTARNQRLSNSRTSSINFEDIPGSDFKQCPVCQVIIVKMDDGSCNHMVCALCGSEFCWLCMRVVGDLHYLSPSGCTFWGKKPWSKKKKLLWQLGTLLGAPIGILLVAGIAIPALLVGIPIWVAPRLYRRYQSANKHKRNFAVFTGTLASILMSPIVAGLTISVGIPILLFYVYGIVPISLCRNRYGDKKKNPKKTTAASLQNRMAPLVLDTAASAAAAASAGIEPTVVHQNQSKIFSTDEIDTKTIFDDINLDILGNVSIDGESMISGSQILHADYEKDIASISNKALAGSIVSNTLLNLSPIPHIDEQNDFFKINVTIEKNIENQETLKESLSAVLGLPIQIENSNETN